MFLLISLKPAVFVGRSHPFLQCGSPWGYPATGCSFSKITQVLSDGSRRTGAASPFSLGPGSYPSKSGRRRPQNRYAGYDPPVAPEEIKDLPVALGLLFQEFRRGNPEIPLVTPVIEGNVEFGDFHLQAQRGIGLNRRFNLVERRVVMVQWPWIPMPWTGTPCSNRFFKNLTIWSLFSGLLQRCSRYKRAWPQGDLVGP